MGTLRILEAIRQTNSISKFKFYQAGTSEMFGKVQEAIQSETTPFYPRSPYGVSKVFGYWMTKNYREAYGMFACTGILFNHESERRGEEFVTRKITLGLRDWIQGNKTLELGNLDAKRDWGHAEDYVEAMWLMLQQNQPEDFVIGTGETHSVDEFLTLAFEKAGLGDFRPYVKHDPKYFRPAEVDLLIGDPSKAEKKLGWKREVGFDQLVDMMVQHDIAYETNRLKKI
jgi:GDPmannose 4,6-dehydratase